MKKIRIAGFMSGSGTNLRNIIEKSGSEVVVIFTDKKESNAREISLEFGIPLIERDIKEFYLSRGFSDRSNMKVREEYDLETANELKKFNVNLVALCGYRSIITSRIYSKFITLNIHPADLTRVDEKGKRIYAGCAGTDCIRRAKANGDNLVRSTVHLVNGDVDGGQIIAVSAPVWLEGDPESVQDELKVKGDWVIYPAVIKMIAEGVINIDEKRKVHFKGAVMKDGYRF